MKFGVSVGNFDSFGDEAGVDGCLEVAREADELGFDSVWVDDQVVVPESVESRCPYSETGSVDFTWSTPAYEPLVMMSALAAATSRVRIGSSMLVLPYRHPFVTAKMLATADILSQGRIVLGIGVGWMREEFEALGLPRGYFKNRASVTTEFLRAIKEAWISSGPSTFLGQYVTWEDVGTYPKPIQKPHPPIIVGGTGPKAMLRAVWFGNGYQAVSTSPDAFAAEVSDLRDLCLRENRDASEVEVHLCSPIRLTEQHVSGKDRIFLTGSPEQVVTDLLGYAKAGLQHIICTPSLVDEANPLDAVTQGMTLFAQEILPLFR